MDLSYYSEAKVAALEAAFARVRPAANWKHAIDVVLEASVAEIGDIKEAVTFYTGSVARVTRVTADGRERPAGLGLGLGTNDGAATVLRVRIRAVGYYAAIGA